MVAIDKKLHDSPIRMNYLDEGTSDISEPMDGVRYVQIITAPMIHTVEVPSADEANMSQMGVACEGRDTNDIQAAKFISHIFTAYRS
ncbi:MAG: hypothetical protein SFZ02_09710 [bacterium]|nr:hypothetical protein [bacterium]